MSISMSKRKLKMVVAGAILMAAGAASAGYKTSVGGVRMSSNTTDYSGFASGVLSIIRASADTSQRLYCYSYPTFGACVAFSAVANANGISCSTQDPGMLALIRSINGDSYVYFQADSTGTCTNLYVSNDSAYQPKTN